MAAIFLWRCGISIVKGQWQEWGSTDGEEGGAGGGRRSRRRKEVHEMVTISRRD